MFLGLLALRQAMRRRALRPGRASAGTHCPGYWPAVSSAGTPVRPARAAAMPAEVRGVMSNHRSFPRTLAALLLAALAVGARGDELLTTADVVRFLKAGISESTILTELGQRGFGEPLDDSREAALREAGASETLIVAIRRTAPPAAVAAPPAPSPGGTRREAPLPRTPGPRGLTFGVAARSVRVPVSVLDKKGDPVLGLHEADFRVSEDGRRQNVTYFSGERRPLRIALALD